MDGPVDIIYCKCHCKVIKQKFTRRKWEPKTREISTWCRGFQNVKVSGFFLAFLKCVLLDLAKLLHGELGDILAG